MRCWTLIARRSPAAGEGGQQLLHKNLIAANLGFGSPVERPDGFWESDMSYSVNDATYSVSAPHGIQSTSVTLVCASCLSPLVPSPGHCRCSSSMGIGNPVASFTPEGLLDADGVNLLTFELTCFHCNNPSALSPRRLSQLRLRATDCKGCSSCVVCRCVQVWRLSSKQAVPIGRTDHYGALSSTVAACTPRGQQVRFTNMVLHSRTVHARLLRPLAPLMGLVGHMGVPHRLPFCRYWSVCYSATCTFNSEGTTRSGGWIKCLARTYLMLTPGSVLATGA